MEERKTIQEESESSVETGFQGERTDFNRTHNHKHVELAIQKNIKNYKMAINGPIGPGIAKCYFKQKVSSEHLTNNLLYYFRKSKM